jgi:quercetin dioxygenase-like cupin family protein
MRYTYPHIIDNGAGEQLTFMKFIENESGGILEIENNVHPGGGPPMHVHHLQDESLTVIKGKLGAKIEGRYPTFHDEGETVTFRRGEVHRFWNAGDDVLICRGWVTPANNLEYFLTEIFSSTKANGGTSPFAFDGAYLLSKYKSEVDMMEIPPFVKKIIFPITLMLGKLAGKNRKFSEAPEAVQNSWPSNVDSSASSVNTI